MPRRNAADLLKLEIAVRLQNLQRRGIGAAPLDIDAMAAVDQNLGELLQVAERYDAGAQAVAADPDLSAAGRSKAREKLARATLQRLSVFEDVHVRKPRERAAELGARVMSKGAIERPTDPAGLAIYTAQLRTLWETFRQADPLEVDLFALTATDPLVQDALATAPPVLRRPDRHSPQALVPLVNPERVQAAAATRARARDPHAAEEMEKLERLARVYEGSVAGVKAVIVEQVAEAQDDPVVARAR